MTYDEQGVLSTFRDADGGGEMVLSSDGGQATGMLLGPAGSPIEVTVGRDALGRMTSMTGPDGATSTAVYDADGMQTELVDPNGHVQRWDYDERGLLTAAYDKADLATTYVYDDASRLVSQTDRNGDTLTYTYDALGRLERVDGPDTFVSFTYDAVGRVLSVTNPEQVLGFTWGIDGELLTATSGPVVLGAYPELTHTYTWSPGGRLDQVASTHGSVAYAYDHQGRVVSQVDSRTGEVSYGWAPDGRLLSLTRASGWTTTFDYTAGDRLERTQTVEGNVLVQDDVLEWDLFGLLGAATDTFGRHTYTYDAGGQLLAADHPASSGIPDESYTYDPLGNRTSWQGHPQSDVVHDAQDRLVQDADFFYTYDAEGQLVSKEDRGSGHTTTYAWNSFGQLVRMEHPDGSETTFAYDGLGRRVQVVDKGEVTRFGWDGDEVRMAFDGANALSRWEATDLFGELLATYDPSSGIVDEVVRNHLGTNQEQARDSFGNPVLATTGFSSHALTWHTQDPTGLIYARARYLDPKTGRFLSEDPIVSGNRYGYALNNPLTMWDPYGLTAATEDGALRRISLGSQRALKEIGEEIACQLFADAAAVALSPTLGTLIEVGGCGAVGRRPKGRGGKGPGGGGPGCSLFSFEAGTPVSTPGGDVAIEALELGDRVVAQSVAVEVGTELPLEPVAASCPEPTYVAERRLGAAEVLVYAPVSGQWSVAPRSTLTGDSTWWSGGVLHRGRTPLGPASIESLRLADVTYESSPAHEAPCPSAWVLVLADGPAHHARLMDVPAGTLVAYAGRVLRTGEGTVQPTGEVLSRVVDTFSRTAEGVFELEVELPDGSLTWLSATAEHPFYAVEAGKYVSVRHLEVGARLHVEGGGDALLVSKTWRQGGVEVFNVEVAGEHNFFAAGVLTHNAKVRKECKTGNGCNEPYKPTGPCGLRVRCKSRKEAYERAKQRGNGAEPILHPDHQGHGPHYHPNVPDAKYDYDPSRPPAGPSSHDHYFFPCR